MKKRNWKKILGYFVAISFLVPVGFLIFRLIFPNENLPRQQSDYLLMLIQCLLGIIALALPTVISHKWKLEIPSGMYALYVLFLYCSIFLGEVRSFYYEVPNWDTYLHVFSGAMIGALGFSVIRLLNEEESIHMKLTPLFVAIFAFCFSVTLGAIWEIYEYTADGIMGLNMQKFITAEGAILAGRAALADTMKDIIVDTVGALAISVIGYISLKYEKGWVEKLLVVSVK